MNFQLLTSPIQAKFHGRVTKSESVTEKQIQEKYKQMTIFYFRILLGVEKTVFCHRYQELTQKISAFPSQNA